MIRSSFHVFLVVVFAALSARAADDVALLPAEREALAAARTQPIIVGVTDSPPFCSEIDGKWVGLSIELLDRTCEALGIKYHLKPHTLDELLRAVEQGDIAVASAALDITADRAERFRFSHSFYHAGYGVAVNERLTSHFATLQRFFSPQFFLAVGSLAALLLIAGFIVWLMDRRHKESDFGGSIAHGLGSGLWWSAVTMSTVGYGDKAPRTVGGRLVAIIWIFVSVIVISSFTGAIASSLTVSSIKSSIAAIDDLRSMSVASVRGSTAEEFLRARGIHSTSFATLTEAITSVQAGANDAVVHDAPILRYTLDRAKASDVSMSDMHFGRLAYAFGFPVDSHLARPIGVEILDQIESDRWPGLVERHLSLRE